MEKSNLVELEELLKAAAHGLNKVSARKMFGCYALWADENVFALVWKSGRIGVKLPYKTEYESLINIEGSEPWTAGTKKMSHWVLVPHTFHSTPVQLRDWVVKAHSLCISLSKNPSASQQSSPTSKKK